MKNKRIKELLIELLEMVRDEYKELDDEVLVESIMDIIGSKLKEFIKLSTADKYDFLVDAIYLKIYDKDCKKLNECKVEYLGA